jgi:hypothetical protein
VITAVLGLWLTPTTFELNNTHEVVTCEPFVGGTTYGGMWPYINEINDWVESASSERQDQDAYLKATMGMLDRCAVARQNREVALMLTALAGATLLIITRPRHKSDATPAAENTHTKTDVD